MLLSPPSRRRGLKFISVNIMAVCTWSPPSRRRGLKFPCKIEDLQEEKSPPSRRRGLKYIVCTILFIKYSRLLLGGVD